MSAAFPGRARVAYARRARRALVVLLILPFGLITLNRLLLDLAEAFLPYATASAPARVQVVLASRLMYCVGPLIGGVLVDCFGTRTTVGLAAIGWCAVASLGASLLDPVTFAILAPPLLLTLPGILHAGALAAVRRGFAPGRRALAFVVVTLAYATAASRPFALYDALVRPLLDPQDKASWQMPALALAAFGAVLTGIWLVAFRDSDEAAAIELGSHSAQPFGSVVADIRQVATQPIVWGLILVRALYGLIDRQIAGTYVWAWQMLRDGIVGAGAVVPTISAAVAALIAAVWSDWVLRKTRSLARARQPFIVLAFAALVFVPYAIKTTEAPGTPQAAGPALLAGTALGALRMLDLLVIDLAPRDMAGRFVGFLLTAELVLLVFIAPVIDRLEPGLGGICIGGGIAGAVLSAVVFRRIKQARDDNRSLFVQCFT